MTIEQIQDALQKLVAMMLEKNIPMPDVDATIKLERVFVYMTAKHGFKFPSGGNCEFFRGNTWPECFEKAKEFVKGLPSADELVMHEYLKKVSGVIDYATEHSIEDKYVQPLRDVTCAMTENLLAKPEGV